MQINMKKALKVFKMTESGGVIIDADVHQRLSRIGLMVFRWNLTEIGVLGLWSKDGEYTIQSYSGSGSIRSPEWHASFKTLEDVILALPLYAPGITEFYKEWGLYED